MGEGVCGGIKWHRVCVECVSSQLDVAQFNRQIGFSTTEDADDTDDTEKAGISHVVDESFVATDTFHFPNRFTAQFLNVG